MQYVMPFIVAMVVTMVCLPALVRLAVKWLMVDHPGARKVHSIAIPRVGGVAMACGVFIASLFTINLQPADIWFLAAAAVLTIFGALDDRFDLDYRAQVIGHFVAVALGIAAGAGRFLRV